MSGFDRIKPPEQRLIEREGRTAADGEEGGRSVLFSAGAPGTDDPALELGGLALRCERCGTTTAVGLPELVRAALPLVVVNPWRRTHPIFALCPACAHRSWLAVVRP